MTVADDIAQLVNFDLAVGVPFAFGGGAVQTQEFDQFQTVLADLDGLECLLGVEHGLLVVLHDLAQHTVADEAVDGDGVAGEQALSGFTQRNSA